MSFTKGTLDGLVLRIRPLILNNAKLLSIEFDFEYASFEEIDVLLGVVSSSSVLDGAES